VYLTVTGNYPTFKIAQASNLHPVGVGSTMYVIKIPTNSFHSVEPRKLSWKNRPEDEVTALRREMDMVKKRLMAYNRPKIKVEKLPPSGVKPSSGTTTPPDGFDFEDYSGEYYSLTE